MINEKIDFADIVLETLDFELVISEIFTKRCCVPNVPKSQFRRTVYVTANLKIFYLRKYFECWYQ